MTEQDKKKLAEWAGFKLATPVNITKFYTHPSLSRHIFCQLPDFPHDLNACFKWLVPEALRRGYTVTTLSFRQMSGLYYSETKIYEEQVIPHQVKCGTLLASAWEQGKELDKIVALALCEAILKLIKEVR